VGGGLWSVCGALQLSAGVWVCEKGMGHDCCVSVCVVPLVAGASTMDGDSRLLRVDCETREVAQEVQRVVTSHIGSSCTVQSCVRVRVSALGLKVPPVLTGVAATTQAAADAAKYGWGVRSWGDLGSQRSTLVVVCAGDGWLDLAGRQWLTCACIMQYRKAAVARSLPAYSL
jgi:hypothetical protein